MLIPCAKGVAQKPVYVDTVCENSHRMCENVCRKRQRKVKESKEKKSKRKEKKRKYSLTHVRESREGVRERIARKIRNFGKIIAIPLSRDKDTFDTGLYTIKRILRHFAPLCTH